MIQFLTTKCLSEKNIGHLVYPTALRRWTLAHWNLGRFNTYWYQDIRLVGGSHQKEGRVEILHDGKWGTICDDSWDINDANVACRQLCFTRASYTSKKFGQGS